MLDKYLHEIIERLGKNSRAASTSTTSERRECIQTSNMLISAPIMSEPVSNEGKGPEIIDLQEYAKSRAAFVPGINKVKAIHDFIMSNGRV